MTITEMTTIPCNDLFMCECCDNHSSVPCECLTETQETLNGPATWCVVHGRYLPEGL